MIFRTPKTKPPFTLVPNHIINAKNLSCKAKAILIYLLSKPENWQVYESDIVKHCRDGKQAIRTGIHELIETGYIRRGQNRMQDGKFGSYEYDVSDNPDFIIKSTEVRKSDIGKSDISNINKKRKLKTGKIIHIHQDPFEAAAEIHQAERVQEMFNQIVQ